MQDASVYAAGAELYYDVRPGNEFERALRKGFPEKIPAADVVHLRWLSMDGIEGISRVGLLRNAIGLSLAMEQSQSGMFARGAQLPGYWKTDKKLGDEAFKRLKAQLAGYEGSENAGRTPLTEEGLTFEKFAMTMVESDTVAAAESQMKRVAIGWDLPLHRIGIVPEGSDPIQMHQMYLNNTLSSDAERWEAKLNDMFDLDGEEEFVEFDLDYFNRASPKDRLEAARIAVVGSIFSVNEARRYVQLGLSDDPKGDEIFQPANVVPLGTEPKASEPTPATPPGPGSDTTGEPAAGGDGDPAAVPPVDDEGKD
jgi:HK97 family phage portal protein